MQNTAGRGASTAAVGTIYEIDFIRTASLADGKGEHTTAHRARALSEGLGVGTQKPVVIGGV